MILDKKKWAVATILTISLSFLWINRNLSFNFDFEDFFGREDPAVSFYQEFRKNFEDDAQFILIGIDNKTSIFSTDFLKKTAQLADSLKLNPLLTKVTAPTSLKKISISSMGQFSSPLLRYHSDTLLKLDSAYLFKLPELRATLIDSTASKLCIVVKATSPLSPEKLNLLATSLDNTVRSFHFNDYHIAGKLIAENMYINKTKEELLMFSGISAVLIVAFLLLTYRSFWFILSPLLIVSLAVLWATGFMTLTNKSLDLLMSLLPSIMFVVGVSDAIHFFSKYIEELRLGTNKKTAIENTVKQVGTSTLLTSVTTAIGFFTLYFINIKPIQDFGIYCGLGVLFAFIITILLLPPLLYWLPEPRITQDKNKQSNWNKLLKEALQVILKHPKRILLSSSAIVILALLGINTIRVNSTLIDDLKEDDPVKVDFNFFDQYFTGARPFEMALFKGHSVRNLMNVNSIDELEKLEKYLKKEYRIKQILSPNTVIKGLNQALHSGLPEFFKIPESKKELLKSLRWLKKIRKKEIYLLTYNDSLNIGRLSGKMADIGSYRIKKQNKNLENFIAENINPAYLKVRLTGSAPLIDKNNETLAYSMLMGLLTAFFIIALIMGLLFSSTRMMLIALIPNIIPLLILASIMGYGHIDLKLSTSIVFTIAFGIAVDDTIHFMARYRNELLKGKSKLYAIKRTFISTGKALIVTSFILSAGFMCLVLSSFMGTFYTGLFVSLTLIFALIADLLLLPVLLLLFDKK